jgi:capsular polysaccharide biosynthesis protein
VDDPDANRAARLSNAVAGAFISQISGQVVTAGYPVVIFQPAVAPTTPDHPKPLLNTLIGGTFGLAVAIILVQLLDVLDTRTRAAQPADNRVYPNSNQKDNSTDLADVKTKAE